VPTRDGGHPVGCRDRHPHPRDRRLTASISDPTPAKPDWWDTITQHVRTLGKAWGDSAVWEGTGNVPGSDLSNEKWGKITLTEMVVHGWDIANTAGMMAG